RIEMAARYVADRIHHRQHRQAERERDAREADAEVGERRGEHRAAAAAAHQPGRPEEFRTQPLADGHESPPVMVARYPGGAMAVPCSRILRLRRLAIAGARVRSCGSAAA